jgi:arginyl-tRNA synthetase
MPTAQTPFARAAAEVTAQITGVPAESFKVETPPRPDLGDFAVGCFAAAKTLKKSPAAVATEVAAAFQPNEWLTAAVATGPFVNYKADRVRAYRWLFERALGATLVPPAEAGETICIDYSSPNISKHLAYHHIRSTVIGHALAGMHRALGAKVVGINHLGDWGTTHGMIIAAWKLWGDGNVDALDISAINALYTRFRAAMDTDPSLEQQGRDWFKRLEDGDAEARALWQRFRDISWKEFASAYAVLEIEFDEVRGESAYEPDLPGVMTMLRDRGLVVESQGAQVVELEGEKTPVLLMTKDGTTLYTTRDVAAAMYRWNTYHFTRSLYVVDRGQALHFRQLFKLLTKVGFDWAARCEHVPFGLVRIAGKKTGTRAGNVVLLKEVFAEATDEVRPRVREGIDKHADVAVSPEEFERIVAMVGVGAIVFANLIAQREKDVDFDLEKVTSLSGDSGPYLLYSHARCAGIVRKGGGVKAALDDETLASLARLTTDAEWAVARRLLDLGEVVARAAAASEPHVVCHYLLDLAGDFSRWYTAGNDDASLRVLCEDIELRHARLALTATVQAGLREGLAMLGLGAPDVM